MIGCGSPEKSATFGSWSIFGTNWWAHLKQSVWSCKRAKLYTAIALATIYVSTRCWSTSATRFCGSPISILVQTILIHFGVFRVQTWQLALFFFYSLHFLPIETTKHIAVAASPTSFRQGGRHGEIWSLHQRCLGWESRLTIHPAWVSQ